MAFAVYCATFLKWPQLYNMYYTTIFYSFKCYITMEIYTCLQYFIHIIPGMNIITDGNTLSHYQYRALCTHTYK
jgi:hypothetical protein